MAFLQSNVGWDDVTILKKPTQGNEQKSQKAIKEAQRKGIEVETTKKYAAGTNKQRVGDKNTLKLETEDDVVPFEKISLDVGKIIMQARQNLNMTQKDLAVKICEKPQIVNEYENCKAIPNQQIITKLERALGVKLRGKDKGKPLSKPTTASKTAPKAK